MVGGSISKILTGRPATLSFFPASSWRKS